MEARPVLPCMKTIAAVALVLCVGSCSLVDREAEVTVLLPPGPTHWRAVFPRMWFLIVWPDAKGRFQTMKALPGQSRVGALCPKSGNTPVLAFPMTTEPGDEGDLPGPLRPAGGLFPLSCTEEGDSVLLSLAWQDGPIAFVLQKLLSGARGVL